MSQLAFLVSFGDLWYLYSLFLCPSTNDPLRMWPRGFRPELTGEQLDTKEGGGGGGGGQEQDQTKLAKKKRRLWISTNTEPDQILLSQFDLLAGNKTGWNLIHSTLFQKLIGEAFCFNFKEEKKRKKRKKRKKKRRGRGGFGPSKWGTDNDKAKSLRSRLSNRYGKWKKRRNHFGLLFHDGRPCRTGATLSTLWNSLLIKSLTIWPQT